MLDLKMFQRLFPGSAPITWAPDQGDGAAKVFNGQVNKLDQLIGFLKEREAPGTMVTYGEMLDFLGNPSRSYLLGPNMLGHPRMVDYLKQRWTKYGGPGQRGSGLGVINEA